MNTKANIEQIRYGQWASGHWASEKKQLKSASCKSYLRGKACILESSNFCASVIIITIKIFLCVSLEIKALICEPIISPPFRNSLHKTLLVNMFSLNSNLFNYNTFPCFCTLFFAFRICDYSSKRGRGR